MVGTLVRQLAKNATTGQIENSPLAQYFIDHGRGVYPADAAGNPWSAATIASSDDAIMNLVEDLAAEQKARATYDNILRVSDDPDVNKVIKFLREREIVHFQRFGDTIHTYLRKIYPYKTCLERFFVCKSNLSSKTEDRLTAHYFLEHIPD